MIQASSSTDDAGVAHTLAPWVWRGVEADTPPPPPQPPRAARAPSEPAEPDDELARQLVDAKMAIASAEFEREALVQQVRRLQRELAATPPPPAPATSAPPSPDDAEPADPPRRFWHRRSAPGTPSPRNRSRTASTAAAAAAEPPAASDIVMAELAAGLARERHVVEKLSELRAELQQSAGREQQLRARNAALRRAVRAPARAPLRHAAIVQRVAVLLPAVDVVRAARVARVWRRVSEDPLTWKGVLGGGVGMPAHARGALWRRLVRGAPGVGRATFVTHVHEAKARREGALRVRQVRDDALRRRATSVDDPPADQQDDGGGGLPEPSPLAAAYVLVDNDVRRTFTHRPAEGGPEESAALEQSLRDVLNAYALFDPGVGYCQGMNFVVALLLRQMDAADAFVVLAGLMQAHGLRELFTPGLSRLNLALYQLDCLLPQVLPRLAAHFQTVGIHPSMYASSWVMTLFSSLDTLPLATVERVWDEFLLRGWKAVFRVVFALLARLEPQLVKHDFSTIVELLHHVPLDDVPPEELLGFRTEFKVTNRVLRGLEVAYLG